MSFNFNLNEVAEHSMLDEASRHSCAITIASQGVLIRWRRHRAGASGAANQAFKCAMGDLSRLSNVTTRAILRQTIAHPFCIIVILKNLALRNLTCIGNCSLAGRECQLDLARRPCPPTAL